MINKINLFYNFYDNNKKLRIVILKNSIYNSTYVRVFSENNVLSFRIKNSIIFDCYSGLASKKLYYVTYD